MIKTSIDFEKQFIENFGDIDRVTLSALTENKLRFELGGGKNGLLRIKQASDRSNQIVQYCFNELPIWLRIILWDENAELNLNKAGLIIENVNNTFKNKYNEDEEVLYLYFNRCVSSLISPIITSIINYDLAEDPSADITCYFINLEKSIIINVYDDRGMDVYSPNKENVNEIADKFHDWLI